MKRKSVLIILVIFICCVAGILVNHIQQKITSQQLVISADKNVVSVKKSSNTNKNKSVASSAKTSVSNDSVDNNTSEEQSKSKVGNTASANTSSRVTDSSGTSSNGATMNSTSTNNTNASKNAQSNVTSAAKTSVDNSTEESNFSIIDHENSSKNYSSHENLAGMSVADITISVLRRQGIYIQYTTSITGIYVSDINHQAEKSKGPSSGWVYYVNGNKASLGASSYKLNSGDKVEWQFWSDAINN